MQLNLKVPTKRCSCCGRYLPVSEFHRQSYTDQVSNQCKECVNLKRRVARQKPKTGKFISKEKQREMTQDIPYTHKDWADAQLHFGGKCAFCRTPEGRSKAARLDRDHLVAISAGGKTTRGNIVPACRVCNRGRGNREWHEWFRKQAFWTPEQEALIQQWVDKNE